MARDKTHSEGSDSRLKKKKEKRKSSLKELMSNSMEVLSMLNMTFQKCQANFRLGLGEKVSPWQQMLLPVCSQYQ